MTLNKKPVDYGEPRIYFSLLLMYTGKHFSSVGRTQNFKSNHQGNSLQGLQVHPGLSYMKTARVIKI